MNDDDRILNMMVNWDEARAKAGDSTIEQPCVEDPVLQQELRKRIERREKLLAAMSVTDMNEPPNYKPIPIPRIDRFDLVEVLGRGGMGVVYKARQIGLNRVVAIKTLVSGTSASPTESARIRGEAEAVAKLRHPNIIQIYEIGDHEGTPYLVLEYAAGGSLAEQLTRNPMAPEQAARIMLSLAEAVHHAHEAGIIHRDLKPANVLMDHEGKPKIADFGLAKRLDLNLGHTQPGDVLGSPSYMSPEQAEGRIEALGPTTDIYALGTILYEMLTGRPPFQGATLYETIDQVRTHEPASPSTLRPKLPRDLETICLKCLRKGQGDRYQSAKELAEDLKRYLEGAPINARSLTLVEHLHRSLRVMAIDKRVGRLWGTIMLCVAPLVFIGHFAVYLLTRGTPNFVWCSLIATAITIAMIHIVFWSLLWPKTKLLPRPQRRLVGSLMAGFVIAYFLMPTIVLCSLPLYHPEEAFIIYPIWLVLAGTIFMIVGSQVGALYLTAMMGYTFAILTALFPMISPILVAIVVGVDLVGQGVYLRKYTK